LGAAEPAGGGAAAALVAPHREVAEVARETLGALGEL